MRYPLATNSETEQNVQSLKTGDIVTVDIDFHAIEVKYYIDDQFVGKNSLLAVKDMLMEGNKELYKTDRTGKIFPAIDISQDSQVSLVPRHKLKIVDDLAEKLGELGVM